MDLHAHGYRSAYLDEPLIAGLQPESFSSFIGQRSRWAQGMIQILLLKNVLWRSGLSLADAKRELEAQSAASPEVRRFLDFILRSQRGITR